MTIRNRILLVVLSVILLTGFGITAIWNNASKQWTERYLNEISRSTMNDAYDAFRYILTDTSYMATMISLNKNDIIQPVELLSRGDLKENGQWNQVYLDNSRIIKSFISGQYGAKYYIVGINILVGADCRITTTSVVLNDTTLAKKISQVDQEQLKRTVVMLDPVYVEGGNLPCPATMWFLPSEGYWIPEEISSDIRYCILIMGSSNPCLRKTFRTEVFFR